MISHSKTFRTMSYSIYFLFLHIFFWHVYWNENNLNWKNRISFKRKNLNSKNNTVSPKKMHAKEASDDGRENISIFYPEFLIQFTSPRSVTREILTAQHARGDKKSLPEDNNNELMRTMENVNWNKSEVMLIYVCLRCSVAWSRNNQDETFEVKKINLLKYF